VRHFVDSARLRTDIPEQQQGFEIGDAVHVIANEVVRSREVMAAILTPSIQATCRPASTPLGAVWRGRKYSALDIS
jgi:hypothetical protein